MFHCRAGATGSQTNASGSALIESRHATDFIAKLLTAESDRTFVPMRRLAELDQKLMGSSGRYSWGAHSITGDYRENNEDRFHVDGQGHFFLVADGMGGQSAGEKASELAVEIVSERLTTLVDFGTATIKSVIDSLDKAVASANTEIMALGELEPSFKNMGTTIAFVVVVGDDFLVGGIGDSRVYLLRRGKLQQLTEDHSLTQALVRAGTIAPEDAVNHRYRNVLYRYLGTKDGGSRTEPQRVTPQTGDRFLICSDGITDGLDTPQIEEMLATENDPQQAAEKLIESAQKGGSRDNITAVVIHVS